MAETTGLLNRRTGHSVPRVRISSSPQSLWDAAAQRFSAGLFWYTADESLLADDVCRNSTNDRQVVGCSISKDCKVPSPEIAAGPRPDGISSSSSLPHRHTPAKQPHTNTPYGHPQRPSPCAKPRYPGVAHIDPQRDAQKRPSGAAIWRNKKECTPVARHHHGAGVFYFWRRFLPLLAQV